MYPSPGTGGWHDWPCRTNPVTVVAQFEPVTTTTTATTLTTVTHTTHTIFQNHTIELRNNARDVNILMGNVSRQAELINALSTHIIQLENRHSADLSQIVQSLATENVPGRMARVETVAFELQINASNIIAAISSTSTYTALH